MNGKNNISIGFLTMGLFMAYGFLLIYLRDFAPGKEEWVNSYSIGKHFESRLAHVHGNLFAFLNILIGYLLFKLDIGDQQKKIVSWLGVIGILMPVGILMELILNASPIFVLVGAVSITASVYFLGVFVAKSKKVIL